MSVIAGEARWGVGKEGAALEVSALKVCQLSDDLEADDERFGPLSLSSDMMLI